MVARLLEKSTTHFDVKDVIQNASLSEKLSLLAGQDFWHTVPLPKFNVPAVRFTDGPNGARGTKFSAGVPAACLPCGTGLASTWDRELIFQAGVLLGEECKAKGAQCLLGPTVCIQRSPLGGRSFESLSEYPYVTGKLAGSCINGLQSTGVVATIKHYLANDQEHERVAVNVIVNSRALREIHMLPFQIAIADSSPGAVMACYNKVNGTHVSESKELLDGILREEWGWNGLIMSDWFGTYSTTEALNAGLDLEMPGPARLRGRFADLAVSSRKVTCATIDTRARNVLDFVKRTSSVVVSEEEAMRDYPEDRVLNRKLAADSVVLLKNESGALPLKQNFKSIALIGPNMKTAAFCGGGSASLEPYYAISPYQGIVEHLSEDVTIRYEMGAISSRFLPALTTPHIATPDGMTGCRITYYCDPPSRTDRRVVDQAIISDTNWQSLGSPHSDLGALFYADIETSFVAASTANWEFGLAVYGTGSLYIDQRLVIDNTTTQTDGVFFFGKGTVEEKAIVPLVEGQTYNLKVEFGSGATCKLAKPGIVNFDGGGGRIGCRQVVDDDELIDRAVQAAKQAEVTVLCAGLTGDWESEGFDRPDMDLPGKLPDLFAAVLEANPDTIVITQSGSPFNMLPWAHRVKSHLHAWYGGNETGRGIADVLFGNVNPSAKLPLSFPRRLEDTPTFLNFGSERGRVVYGEGIYVGYRYYEKVLRDVLYCFGHGLSYTTFSFSELNITPASASLNVQNTGACAGAEVVQLYIAADERTSSIARPRKELKGFAKVFLQPGETRRVEISFDRFTTAFWDEVLLDWVCERGDYRVLIGSSSQDIRLDGVLKIGQTTTWTGL